MRLRLAEYLMAAAAVVALVSLLVLHLTASPTAGWWSYPPLSSSGYSPRYLPAAGAGDPPGSSGWQALPVVRWFVLVSVALALAAVVTQAVRRGPAVAVTLDLLAMLAAGVTTILLGVALATERWTLAPGAYIEVIAVAALASGALRAMRTEQGWTPGPDHPVELVTLPPHP
jgi:hypothetical protein